MPTQNTAPTPEAPEKQIAPEQLPEQAIEKELAEVEITLEQASKKLVLEKTAEQAPAAPAPTPAPSTAVEQPKSEDLVRVENILSEGLGDLYKDLPENRRAEFKQKGEQTARSITTLLQATKVHMYKVVKLIIEWLKMIPGVNKFFLEQEAKIKADKLLECKKEKEH